MLYQNPASLDELLALRNVYTTVILPATGMPYLDYWQCIVWADSRKSTEEYYTRVVYASPANKNELWKLNVTNGVKSGWVCLSDRTPPQEFNLPLAEGITALQPCTYWKNQFGEVTIGGCTSGAVSDGSTIATLPEGYRPSHYVERPATFTEGGSRFAGSVFIDTAGIVTIHMPAEATNVVFAASFLAKN